MNKNRFRVVFNQARGLMMVIAERASSHSVAGASHSSPPLAATILATLRPIALAMLVISGQVMVTGHAFADIIADPNAAANQRPVIIETANGLPLVNIQTPSAAGVSRNAYSQFDVNAQGVILNNSNANVQTQIGGWVQGNPYLAGGTAKVILNEVNSQNPSLLNGYIEVAGSRAQVVIANPAGISCNGCGFINANRATLTTGTPIVNSGNLLGYRVGGGTVSFLGDGLDTSQTNFTDVIARAVEVNAGIWANALHVTTGTNQVNIDSNGDQTSATPIAPDAGSAAPAFAVDVAALGGMYAGKIHMIGTEAGLGVRNAGTLGAGVGEISITADGLLQNTGNINAKTDIQLNTAALESSGSIAADGNIAIQLASDYTHTGELQAGGDLELQTTGDITNQSTILASRSLKISAQNIENTATGEIAGDTTEIHATDTLTNRGLIDGVDTLINADTLTNTQTGSVFGDHLAIQTTHLGNDAGAVIAARDRLDIGAATIENRDNGLLFSAGDLAIGGSLDADRQATGFADSLINENATIEALGEATLAVTDLQNLNAGLETELVVDSTQRILEVQPEGWSQRYDISRFPTINNYGIEAQPFLNESGNIAAYFEDYTFYDYTATTSSTHVISSLPGRILSGGNMTLLGNVTNSDSQIIAGGDLDVSGATLQNLSSPGEQVISYSGSRQFRDWDGNDEELEFGPWVAFSPASQVTAINLAVSQLESNTAPTGSGTTVASVSTPAVTGSLFQPSPDVGSHYLIETNPRFTNYRTWLSSDYMLQQLSFDPATMQKRLGDGFYEQRLVREQIAQLTGRRFLDGHASDEAQYQALMDAGITIANAWQLIPGIALTAEQVAQLTSDIIWLVEETVTLPDGTVTQALVPKVYVRLQPEDLNPTIGLMAGNQVTMDISGDITNSGTIAGRSLVALNADNIRNMGGQIGASILSATANKDIDIQGGALAAQQALVLQAGDNITVASTTVDAENRIGGSTFTRTNINRVAGLYVTGENGVLVASAGNDINLLAAQVINAGQNGITVMDAGNNLNLGTVNIAEQNNSIHSAKDFNRSGYTQEVGTVIQTQGDIALNAGNDFNARAAEISSAAGGVNINAENDIRIESGTATYNSDIANISKRSGTFSSRKKEQRDSFREDTAIASNLSGETINLQAEQDIEIKGSNVVSDNGTTLLAGGNIDITAAEQTFEETHYQKTKRSGISASGASVSIGSQQLMTNTDTTRTTQSGSTVGSIAGDVVIEAGKAYTQTGSDVLAPQGDINISAQSVDIEAAQNTSKTVQETKFKQSGLTLSISNPVISAVQTAQQMSEAASQTSDSRMQALAAGTTALAAKNAYDAAQTAQAKPTTGNSVEDAANQAGGVNLSISIGSSKSSSTSTQTSSSAQGSNVMAGGDINITASGAGTESDINVIGSQVKAGNDVTLKAEDQINLIAAKNTESLNSKNKNSSASVGISIGTSGLAVTASASKGKGKASGNDVTWTETQVEAGNKVTLESGTDTNLIGAQVRGNQVIADVGTSGDGNLNIHSLQDTSTYDSKQKSAGISISIPIGAGAYGGSINSSSSKIESDYASVNEQAGIFAGDQGFQVNVAGNTNLTGAVIASTEQAIADNKNVLTTETLTVSNIQNKAEYEAKGSSATVGYGSQGGLPQLSGAGYGEDSDKAKSTTLSAVSQGIVNVTDNDAQQDLTGTSSVTAVAMLNRDVHVNEQGEAVDSAGNSTANTIAPIFDKEKVQKEIEAQVKITQAFNQEAPRALANFALSKTQPYQDAKDYELIKNRAENNISLTEYELNRLSALEASGMTLEKAQAILNDPQAKSDYENWNGNGDYRRAANIIIAAIGGTTSEVTSAVTKESLSWAADQMRQQMIEDSMKFPGICDSQGNCLDNKSGLSEGVNGDKFKLAGGRVNINELCRNDRCTTNEDGSLTFTGNLAEFLQSEEGERMRSTMGGFQGAKGLFAFFDYEAGTIWDTIAEAYAGTHDMLNSSTWYDAQGNIKAGVEETITGKVGNITNYTNVLLATPFALSVLLPPEVWNAIMVSVGKN
ncbi:filamentous hemagglutinin [Methylophilaceae bacterium]|nr:filamentous hemagglutinin [Methylophilaceae bacterium]